MMKIGSWVLAFLAVAGIVMLAACGTNGARSYHTGSVQPYAPYASVSKSTRDVADAEAIRRAATEELWVIQKPLDLSPTQAPPQKDDKITTGTLATKIENEMVPVPLKHTDVKASLTGYIATTKVTQQFHNPYSGKIEAVYVFPLPENAAVNEFVMTIGERKIRGIIREKEEAQKIYNEARSQGYVASLLTQERPNIFTQSVANIEPGKQIDINITYYHTMTYADGWLEYVFPMVVGPRYNPVGSTDGIGAVGVGSRGASGQKTEVQYLKPTQRSGHDIAVEVDINAGVKIEELGSVNHQIKRRDVSEDRVVVQLDSADNVPNKDFVLRYRIAGDKVKTAMFVQRDEKGKGGWFTLMLVPPAELKSLERRPVEMVFVIDTSGSMSGAPIEQAKSATRRALDLMKPDDTFQIVRFAGDASQMSEKPLPATMGNRLRGAGYVNTLTEGGGTEMLKGISAALDFPHDENRTRVVAFLTDGYIGNEAQILTALHEKLADSRVFSFGVGTSVNRYLLDSMATIGNGAVSYLSIHEKAAPVMEKFFERTAHPALANIKVEFSGMKVAEVYPRKMPDLFVGRPIIVTGRFEGEPRGDVAIIGAAGKEMLRTNIRLTSDDIADHSAIRPIWARMKIADLGDETIRTGRDVRNDVKKVAIEHSLMSQYTAFVAVDSSRKTEGTHGTTVAVPVPVPDGVKYETTVEEKK